MATEGDANVTAVAGGDALAAAVAGALAAAVAGAAAGAAAVVDLTLIPPQSRNRGSGIRSAI